MIEYALGEAAAAKRAWAQAAVAAVVGLSPLVLLVELIPKLGLRPPVAFWFVVGAAAVLVVTRALQQASSTRRRLTALRVIVDDDAVAVRVGGDARSMARSRIARIVAVDGALGGLRLESTADPALGTASVVSIPRGGEGFGEVRARLERWHPVEDRGRHRPAMRLLLGACVIGCIFFLPFVVDDFLSRSKLAASVVVLSAWGVLRWTLRGR